MIYYEVFVLLDHSIYYMIYDYVSFTSVRSYYIIEVELNNVRFINNTFKYLLYYKFIILQKSLKYLK